MASRRTLSKLVFLLGFMTLSSFVLAAPFTTTYTSTILGSESVGPFNQGEQFTISIVLDNGGTTAISQTWTPAEVVAISFIMNDAPNVITTVYSPVVFSNSPTGSFVTDAGGVLTALPELQDVDPGGLAVPGFSTVASTNDPATPGAFFINGDNPVYYNLDGDRAGMTNAANNVLAANWSRPAAPVAAPTTQTINGIVGTAITASTTLTATNFAGDVTYAVSPALPAGLSLDTTTGVISGTPTATQASTDHIITGTGATSGSATTTVTITVVEVSEALSTFTASTSSVVAGSEAALTVAVRDTAGDPVSGLPVTLAVENASIDASLVSITTSPTDTDASGEALFTVASSVAQEVEFRATFNPDLFVSVTWTATPVPSMPFFGLLALGGLLGLFGIRQLKA
ncbi:putative Ig domain-containing protein [Luminiphilus syltensis]|nr:putative Ig domain-containing protein [Luminiphilus syltensis]